MTSNLIEKEGEEGIRLERVLLSSVIIALSVTTAIVTILFLSKSSRTPIEIQVEKTSRHHRLRCEFCYAVEEVTSYKKRTLAEAALELTNNGWGSMDGHIACKGCRETIRPVPVTIDVDGELKVITIFATRDTEKVKSLEIIKEFEDE